MDDAVIKLGRLVSASVTRESLVSVRVSLANTPANLVIEATEQSAEKK